MTPNRLFKAALILAITAQLHSYAWAQDATDYPSEPVRVILPQAPGGGTDTQARLYAAKLSENLRSQFIVENRPGAGNTAGPALVARSPTDGYALLVVTPSFTFTSALYKNLSYDSLKDFAPISHSDAWPARTPRERRWPNETAPRHLRTEPVSGPHPRHR